MNSANDGDAYRVEYTLDRTQGLFKQLLDMTAILREKEKDFNERPSYYTALNKQVIERDRKSIMNQLVYGN